MLKLFTEAQTRLAALFANLQDDEGQTMAEYAVVLAVVTLGIILALGFLSDGINNALGNVTDILP